MDADLSPSRMETYEDDQKYDFNFETDEEASEWRDKLRDAGINANMPSDCKSGVWTVTVTKHDVQYEFWQFWINLRSPRKQIDKSSKYEYSQVIGMLKRIKSTTKDPETAQIIKEFLE